MNPTLKNSIRDTVKVFNSLVSVFFLTIVSIIRMSVLTNFKLAFKRGSIKRIRNAEKCTILANGPSLKAAFENGEVFTDCCDIACVNSFCESEYFWKIKPALYFLIDGEFFNPTIERCVKQVDRLKSALAKVDWPMTLIISTSSGNRGVLEGLTNPMIKVVRINTTTVNGYKWFRHNAYDLYLGMPICQTVTNMAICFAIQLKYKNIYLYGADHGWTKDLRVDDDNVCCYGDRHVFNTALTVIKLDYSIVTLLRNYANMFESHWLLKDYADSVGVKIWNCTRGSFIDAYERFKFAE